MAIAPAPNAMLRYHADKRTFTFAIKMPHLIRVLPRTRHRILRQRGLDALQVFAAQRE